VGGFKWQRYVRLGAGRPPETPRRILPAWFPQKMRFVPPRPTERGQLGAGVSL